MDDILKQIIEKQMAQDKFRESLARERNFERIRNLSPFMQSLIDPNLLTSAQN